jgi:DNA mismatch repair protein MutL
LIPETLKLTPQEYALLNEHKSIFENLWFFTEELSHQMISLQSIPDFVKKQEAKEIFLWILWDIWAWNTQNFKSLDEVKNKIFAYTACRSAIKFGHKLNLFEMNKLLNESLESYSSTCPHGRPVIYEITLDELKNKYER